MFILGKEKENPPIPCTVFVNRVVGLYTENNRYAVILDLKKDNGDYVMVSIEADKKAGDNSIINDIRSIHSRQSFIPLLEKAFESNRILKVDTDKIKDLFPSRQPDIISGGSGTSLMDS